MTFELFSEGSRTRLKLTHTGLETLMPEMNPDLARENFFEGWSALGVELENLIARV